MGSTNQLQKVSYVSFDTAPYASLQKALFLAFSRAPTVLLSTAQHAYACFSGCAHAPMVQIDGYGILALKKVNDVALSLP
jgi:hypothetical protein